MLIYKFPLLFTLIVLLAPLPAQCQNEDAEDESAGKLQEYEVLFDGSSLDKWRGYAKEEIGKGWKIDGDTLHFDGSGGGDIITKATFDDFELEFEWKVSKGGNSGIMYRVSLGDGAPYISGPEYQILDNDGHADGKSSLTSAASLYGLIEASGEGPKPVGEWNHAKIVLKGALIEHWLNGEKVVAIEIGSDDWNERLAKSKFRDWKKFAKNDSGHIAFQDHGDPVWFRNIKIRSLSAKD
ncbi:MAG TPA: DUF1080 domain-containing protein [Pirellulaceae bacterium]|nr:DUF1080 domain-containing protein [Pirellulaceae bacterium]HMO92539.1 DUF1080 domain-containing protein [Pirellulaceae bacterium]HMP68979.1 DUF1080 domain-containing protein [Pirellulaceae bacterium]